MVGGTDFDVIGAEARGAPDAARAGFVFGRCIELPWLRREGSRFGSFLKEVFYPVFITLVSGNGANYTAPILPIMAYVANFTGVREEECVNVETAVEATVLGYCKVLKADWIVTNAGSVTNSVNKIANEGGGVLAGEGVVFGSEVQVDSEGGKMMFFDRAKSFVAESKKPSRSSFLTAGETAATGDFYVIIGAVGVYTRGRAAGFVVLSGRDWCTFNIMWVHDSDRGKTWHKIQILKKSRLRVG